MLQYHYIMQFVWIITSIAVLISSTWMGFREGFDKWWMMYLFLLATLLQFWRHRAQYRKITAMREQKNEQKSA